MKKLAVALAIACATPAAAWATPGNGPPNGPPNGRGGPHGTPPGLDRGEDDRRPPAGECREELADLGLEKFREKHGTNENDRNAFGKCVAAEVADRSDGKNDDDHDKDDDDKPGNDND